MGNSKTKVQLLIKNNENISDFNIELNLELDYTNYNN